MQGRTSLVDAAQAAPPTGWRFWLSWWGWRWYQRHFLLGFCYYLPLLVLLVLPLILVFTSAGQHYGTQHLFYHDVWLVQLTGGLALGVYWFAILFVGFLLDLRDGRRRRLLRQAEEQPPDPLDHQVPFGWYFAAIWVYVGLTGAGCAIVVGLSIMLFGVFATDPDRDRGTDDPPVAPVQEANPLPIDAPAAPPEAEDDPDLVPWYQDLGLWAGVVLAWGVLALAGLAALRGLGWWRQTVLPRLVAWWRGWVVPPLCFRLWWWGLAITVLALWATTIVLSVYWVRDWRRFGWRLVLTCLGALFSTAVVCARPTWATQRPRLLAFLSAGALVANGLLVYVGVALIVSTLSLGILVGLPAGLAWLALIWAAVWTFVPTLAQKLWNAAHEGRERMDLRERNLTLLGLLSLFVLVPGWFAVVAWAGELISPVAIVMLVLFGVVVVYGIFTSVVRRTLIVVLVLMVLFALVSHVQPYPMRLPGLDASYSRIWQLGDLLARDTTRQDDLNAELKRYAVTRDRIDVLTGRLQDWEARLAEPGLDPRDAKGIRAEIAQMKDELAQRRQANAARQRVLQQRWNIMEANNRVRAARFVVAAHDAFSELPLQPNTPLLVTKELQAWDGLAGPAGSGEGRRKKPLVVIAVSGGGIRSAVWVFAVLKRLELAFAARGIDFPSHVRLITGASGGMVGAGYYVVTLPPPDGRAWDPGDRERFCRRRGHLGRQQAWMASDFLTPLVRRAALTDLPSWLSPWPAQYDRGRELEAAWATYLRDPATDRAGALNVSFDKLRDSEKAGERPSLVFTPMMVEDGRRLIVSNLDLRAAISSDGFVLTHKPNSAQVWGNHSVEAIELFRLLPPAQSTFVVGTAARLSASFPYFSPAVSLPSFPRRRVVDAGYYDNYGVSLAASWLFSETNRDWIRDHSDSIVLIQIRDGVSEDMRQLRTVAEDTSDPRTRSLEELSSPVEGLISSWTSSSLFRNDNQLEVLSGIYNPSPRRSPSALWDPPEMLAEAEDSSSMDRPSPIWDPTLQEFSLDAVRFLVVNFELEADVSLSWYLSRHEKRALARAERKIQVNLDKLLQWWTVPLAQEGR
jgi:hypothetical protein